MLQSCKDSAIGLLRQFQVAVLCLASMWASDSVSFGEWKLLRTVDLKGSTNHVQGIDFDANVLWVTSVDSTNRKGYLREFSFVSGEMIRAVEVQQGERFHLAGSRRMRNPFGFLLQSIARTALA